MAPTKDVRVPDTMRIYVSEKKKGEVTKDYLVKNVLFEMMRVKVPDVLAFHDHLIAGYVDITFINSDVFHARAYQLRDRMREDRAKWAKVLEGLELDFYMRKSAVIVYMYDSHVEEKDLKVFLQRYCKTVSTGEKLRDEYGMWTGKWRFDATFWRNQLGDEVLPPGSFFLGPYKGLLYVPGKVQVCWVCGETGHTKSTCKGMFCRHCERRDHFAKDCVFPRKCSLCGKEGHLFRACPGRAASFAEVLRSGRSSAGSDKKGGEKPAEENGGSGTKGHVLRPSKMADSAPGKVGGQRESSETEEAVGDWAEASASQEAEMAELAVGGLKRPSQDGDGIGTPVRRVKAGGGTVNADFVFQEVPVVGRDEAVPVDVGQVGAGACAAPPGGMESEGGAPPKPPERGSDEVLLPGFERVLGAAD